MKNETKMQRSVKSRILAVIAMLLLGISILTSLVVFTDLWSTPSTRKALHTLPRSIIRQTRPSTIRYPSTGASCGCGRPIWKVRKAMPMSALSFHRQRENTIYRLFFVSRDGSYVTLDGERGYLDLGRTLSQLILEQQPIVANSVVPDKPEIMVFAVPTEKAAIRALITKPLPSPITTGIWWTP